MRPFSFGDIFFIVLICGLIYGLLALVSRQRRRRQAELAENPGGGMDDAALRDLLDTAHSIAVVGCSADPSRPSYRIAQYLLEAGYTVYPVNPGATEILGLKVFATLEDLPATPDIVDVFRRSEHVPAIARQALACQAGLLWLQEGVVSPEGAGLAEEGGMKVVMDRCILKEHRRLHSGQ